VLRIDAVGEDMAHLVRRVGCDLEGGDITQPVAVGDGSGGIDAVDCIVVGQGHDSHATGGGKSGDLSGISPTVTDGRMHVEVGEHFE
jgi:hypothetical protein